MKKSYTCVKNITKLFISTDISSFYWILLHLKPHRLKFQLSIDDSKRFLILNYLCAFLSLLLFCLFVPILILHNNLCKLLLILFWDLHTKTSKPQWLTFYSNLHTKHIKNKSHILLLVTKETNFLEGFIRTTITTVTTALITAINW